MTIANFELVAKNGNSNLSYNEGVFYFNGAVWQKSIQIRNNSNNAVYINIDGSTYSWSKLTAEQMQAVELHNEERKNNRHTTRVATSGNKKSRATEYSSVGAMLSDNLATDSRITYLQAVNIERGRTLDEVNAHYSNEERKLKEELARLDKKRAEAVEFWHKSNELTAEQFNQKCEETLTAFNSDCAVAHLNSMTKAELLELVCLLANK